ncbi:MULTISPECIES: cytochrome P450 [Mycobacterium avium complex (MAC)]|uniref:cytochrome P450 n=1 Tax=Mycobacterium avium complex (MAC) TaxID=120793 RepID=UPI0004528F96|nr:MULTISPECIES: cytochrome P450 [Mycobacterium avium complex (MAC)]ETZ36339.1 cytochrome P450 family protein [Mycobacterium intracellulare MIN_061107_1834]MCA2273872.1 cytochrome P450 [Mycobacterium intracellulare]MCA2324593.1 cytochrome P450 [Mycobacterium intracellulare]UEB22701.1 cytochrome P450 [Mycobacterium intracellulare]WVL49919.1 cytochrome P450 [Mycobacterium paraintracellulare]
MTVDTAAPSVFDAGLPTLHYDITDTVHQVAPRIHEARKRSPIALGPLGPEVLGYELARGILRDPRFVFPPGMHMTARGITSGPLYDRVLGTILGMEGEEHRRLRGLVSRAFTPRASARMEDTIDRVINDLIDQVAGAGRCDFVADIARPYPIPIICALLGAPPEDWEQFSLWAEDIFKIVRFDSDLANEQHIVMRAWDEFDAYIDDMIAERRSRLTDDLISELIRAQDDGDRLSNAEMRMLAFSILSAGTDTTRNQLAACMHALCDHPEQLAMLRKNPNLAMPAVEECMRHSPAVCTTLRTVLDDVTFADYTFPAGTFISVNTFAANCDPEVYAHPGRFDITREDPPPILTFGGGAHYCLGANLARTELAGALKVLARRMTNPRRVATAQWKPMLGLSGPVGLEMEFD